MVRASKALGCAFLFICTSTSADVMVGAYVSNDAFSREEIQLVNATVPKPLAYINIFSSFSHDWDHLYWQTTNSVEEGAQPLISWMPIDLQRPDDNLLPEIAIGLHDAYIDNWAVRLKGWVDQYSENTQPRILLRFAHEFNGNWYPYGNSPESLKLAWQRIHDRFTAAGVDQHVEWVWSANNVSVDDYNDITSYYPGAEYVDWTSIDGYNFGSNYAWTSWESFEDTFSDTYNTLVDNYPEKPILIGETGSAEPSDLPSEQWGQYGDDSDASESKERWIADMLLKLETSFPAVRAVTWFNNSKELNWSLTEESSTGMGSFIAGIQSDHYTVDFLATKEVASSVEPSTTSDPEVATESGGDESVGPTEGELRLQHARSTYTDLQSAHFVSLSSWTEVNDRLLAAKRLNATRKSDQEQAKQKLDLATGDYTAARDSFLQASSSLNEARSDYGGKRSTSFVMQENFRDAVEGLDISAAAKKDILNRFIKNRELYIKSRATFEQTRAESTDKYLALAIAREDGLVGDELLPYKEELGAAREKFGVAFQEFYENRTNFRDNIGELATAREDLHHSISQRNTTRDKFRNSVVERRQAWRKIESTFRERADVLDQLTALKRELDASNTTYQEKLVIVSASASELVQLEQEEAREYFTLQDAQDELTRGYTELTEAQQLVSLEDVSTASALLLSDSTGTSDEEDQSYWTAWTAWVNGKADDDDDDKDKNKNKDEDKDKNKDKSDDEEASEAGEASEDNVDVDSSTATVNSESNANTEKKEEKEEAKIEKKELAALKKAVKMDAKEQERLAKSIKPKGLDPAKLAERHSRYNGMSMSDKKKLKEVKLGLVDY